MVDRPVDWHSQDWIIVVEALAAWGGPPAEASGRQARAWELIDGVAADQGLSPDELLRQLEGNS